MLHDNKRPIRGKEPTTKKVKYSTKVVHDDVARLINILKAKQRAKERENGSDDSIASSDNDNPSEDDNASENDQE